MIFTSELRAPAHGYETAADGMAELARQQPGFLGFDSARGDDRVGITVSYWSSLESIRRWKDVLEHREAQAKGREQWYSWYRVRIVEVQREYSFGQEAGR